MTARRTKVGLLLAFLSCVLVSTPASADISGDWKSGGAKITVKDRRELQQIRAQAAATRDSKVGPRFEFASVADCGNNTPDSTSPDDLCRGAALSCAGNTPEQGLGPSVR